MIEDKEQPSLPPEVPGAEAAPEPSETPPAEEPARPADPAPPAAPPPTPAPPRRRGGALAVLALLLALGAGAGTGYLWWQDWQRGQATGVEPPDVGAEVDRQVRPLREAVAELRAELDGQTRPLRDAVAELRAELEAVEQGTAEIRRASDRLAAGRDGIDQALAQVEEQTRRGFNGLERRLTNVENGLAALADTRRSTTEELALAETEFLLRSANERLQLFNDPRGAETALALAQARLEAVDDPIYATVRQTLAGHVQALRQVELPDRVALSGRLLGLARNSVEWPLDARRSLQVSGTNLLTPNEADQGWWPRFKEVLASVVVVHREKQAEAVLLTLEEERLLRENVRLQLQVAQLAAVRGEQTLYDAAIGAVSDWLGEYYDRDSTQVAGAIDALAELRGQELNPPLPDISEALKQLRNVRAAGALATGTEAGA